MRQSICCLVVLILSLLAGAANCQAERRPNVLFIAVDDLRPQLGCYGRSKMHSPNIDRLAKSGILFERSYCMVPTCGASRASLMSGIRPAPSRFVTYQARADQEVPDITTLNTHFKNHGYYTISNGKIFHYPQDNAAGWSEPAWRPKGAIGYHLPENRKLAVQRAKKLGRRGRGPAFESADASEGDYADGKIAEKTIADLRRLKKMDKPFFLASGFFKPHLPFVAPKKYWDLYDPAEINLPENYYPPKNAPEASIHTSGELRSYAGVPRKGPVSDEMARNLIHGYYACVSFTDAQIGKILNELKRLDLEENTIVVLWGDHGWNLGEHTLWCKHSCYETSMHAPLIVRAPNIKGDQKTKGLTEFIDIYPSLCELAGLPSPQHLQGESFVSLMKNPHQAWKQQAIGRYRNGDTIRTDKFRYSEYFSAKGAPLGRMLYDHDADPDENENIFQRPANKKVTQDLSQRLKKGKGKD